MYYLSCKIPDVACIKPEQQFNLGLARRPGVSWPACIASSQDRSADTGQIPNPIQQDTRSNCYFEMKMRRRIALRASRSSTSPHRYESQASGSFLTSACVAAKASRARQSSESEVRITPVPHSRCGCACLHNTATTSQPAVLLLPRNHLRVLPLRTTSLGSFPELAVAPSRR